MQILLVGLQQSEVSLLFRKCPNCCIIFFVLARPSRRGLSASEVLAILDADSDDDTELVSLDLDAESDNDEQPAGDFNPESRWDTVPCSK